MYGKIGLASGALAAGAMLVAGMHYVTWAIVGAVAVVLAGITLYRLATVKARR